MHVEKFHILTPTLGLSGLTDAEIFGQCYGFFLAGYDTTSTTLSFLLYNLALDQAAQEKARQEVLEILTQHVS